MKRDIVIIIEGGLMLGIFGAGVVTAFQEANLYPRLHSIYASSAGAHNAAYFLSKKTRLGASIYYEELTGKRFIKPKAVFRYIVDLLLAKLIKGWRIHDVIDIDYLTNVETGAKKFDAVLIRQLPIRFYVRVFDVERLKAVYLSAKNSTLKTIIASSSAAPFYSKPVILRGKKYIDGSIIGEKAFLAIANKNRNKRIIYISNRKRTFMQTLFDSPKNIFEAFLLGLLFGPGLMWKKLASAFSYYDVKQLLSHYGVFGVINDKMVSRTCVDKEKLLTLYNYGIQKGKQVARAVSGIPNQ